MDAEVVCVKYREIHKRWWRGSFTETGKHGSFRDECYGDGLITTNLMTEYKLEGYIIGPVAAEAFRAAPFFNNQSFCPSIYSLATVQAWDVVTYLAILTDSRIKLFEDFTEKARRLQVVVAKLVRMVLRDNWVQCLTEEAKPNH